VVLFHFKVSLNLNCGPLKIFGGFLGKGVKPQGQTFGYFKAYLNRGFKEVLFLTGVKKVLFLKRGKKGAFFSFWGTPP